MKRNSIAAIIVSFVVVVFIVLFCMFFVLPGLKGKGGVELKVSKIRQEYAGIIIDKYSVRDTPPTHIRIKTKDSLIEISVNRQIVKMSNLGDSIIKPKNENYVFIIAQDGRKNKFFYTKLSFETRNSKYFPKEWRKKWMESSEWDK